jgi:hypothetical protein
MRDVIKAVEVFGLYLDVHVQKIVWQLNSADHVLHEKLAQVYEVPRAHRVRYCRIPVRQVEGPTSIRIHLRSSSPLDEDIAETTVLDAPS